MNRWLLPALLAAIVALFCVRNLPWHLDDYDQAKQAFVSFEMIDQGHWWFQHTPQGRIATKPPLAGWISAALYPVTRWWEGAWRIPPLVSALVILAVLIRAGEHLLPGIGGAVAAGAFALNLTAPRLATLVRTDMMLTLFIFLTGWLVYEKVRTGTRWTAGERWAVFALILGSMLTKGPIAYAFLLPGLVAFALISRWRGTRSNAWCGLWPWFAPLLLFAAWAVIGLVGSREFYEQVVLKEFLGRFDLSDEPVHKHQPVYFYVLHLLRAWVPWSVLFLGLFLVRDVRRALVSDPSRLWLACWIVGGLVLMSLIPSKRADRIFPVFPPMCLLLVSMLREVQPAGLFGQPLRRVAVAFVLLALGISSGYAAYKIADGYRGREGALVSFGRRVRETAAAEGLRLAAVNGRDEGMLLYLRQPRFLKFSEAKIGWETGDLNALVLNEKDFAKNAARLQPWMQRDATGKAAHKNSQYFFIVRSNGSQQASPPSASAEETPVPPQTPASPPASALPAIPAPTSTPMAMPAPAPPASSPPPSPAPGESDPTEDENPTTPIPE